MTESEVCREEHYTLGIAGHIDHGKTTLTKALTGKETDRLIEEQKRKISIELGFASFPLSTGKLVSVIDVPGHERFIRQMVAGVAGIDLVLLIIAADEGVMPQTKEHLDILHLLGVEYGIIVLTKVDTVDNEFLELVEEQVREETVDTFLAESSFIHVDSLSGLGIAHLKEEIEKITKHILPRPIQGIARIPIDRVFSKKGFGTVITGTMYQGKIAVGDELEVLPLRKKVKVRNIQVHGGSEKAAYAGQRVAVNVSDVSVDDLQRGDVIVTKGAVETTHRMDIEFHMLPHLDFEIKQRSAIRLHLGTSEILGRIIFFDRNECKPGDTCFAQLELSEPISTLFEDRFVLRRPTPMTTIGGGMVIDPYAQKHRFDEKTIELIASKKEGDISTRARRLLEIEGIQTIQQLTHKLGISLKDWQENIADHYAESELKLVDGESNQLTLITSQNAWEEVWQQINAELVVYHQRYPLREGIDRKQLQTKHFPALTSAQWNVVLKEAQREEKIELRNEAISQYHFQAKLRERDQQIWKEIQDKMKQTMIEVPSWDELVPKQMPQDVKIDLLRYLLRYEQLIQLEEERYLSTSLFNAIINQLKKSTPNTFSIKDVREVLDTSRKYLIPFLEALDRLGYTFRQESERSWKK